ncbi:hypothetical protein [Pseudomonas fluorescens]|nr:hypothetical protein [Pseudomonas fluorescens]
MTLIFQHQKQDQKIAAFGSSYMEFVAQPAAQPHHSQDERKLGCSF